MALAVLGGMPFVVGKTLAGFAGCALNLDLQTTGTMSEPRLGYCEVAYAAQTPFGMSIEYLYAKRGMDISIFLSPTLSCSLSLFYPRLSLTIQLTALSSRSKGRTQADFTRRASSHRTPPHSINLLGARMPVACCQESMGLNKRQHLTA